MSIANAQVTLDRTNFEYDEQQHAPVVQLVQVGDAELVAFQDYVAYITPATDAGDYNIIVSGMGDYSGAKNVPWHIDKAQGTISVEPQSVSITGAIGTTTTVQLTYKGDGEITLGESEYVTLSREGNTVTVTSKQEGSGNVTITLEDGRNYKGATVELSVSVSSLPEADPVFENNTWETIAAYCAAGKVPETWQIGDRSRPVTRNGVQYHFQIGAKNHYDLAESDTHYNDPNYNGGTNKAALTLIQEEVFTDNLRMDETNSNACSWKDSEFRTDTLQTIKSELDQDFVAVVRKVVIKTAQSGNDATIVETEDDFFMMSEVEVFGTNSYSKAGEGTYLQYFQAGNSRIKYQSGSAKWYWLRSPISGYAAYFMGVGSDGSRINGATSDTGGGVVLCVCI